MARLIEAAKDEGAARKAARKFLRRHRGLQTLADCAETRERERVLQAFALSVHGPDRFRLAASHAAMRHSGMDAGACRAARQRTASIVLEEERSGMGEYLITILHSPIMRDALLRHLDQPFPDMIKCVVDLEREVVAIGGELHADAEELMLEEGSRQKDVWGANLYPNASPGERLEYSALINIRPSMGNRSMEVQDAGIRERIRRVIEKLIEM